MRVDIHSHSYPAHKAPEVIAAILNKTRPVCNMRAYGPGTIDSLIETERHAGFDKVAICPIATRPEQITYMLKYLSALRSGALGALAVEHVIPCASLHPEDTDAERHLDQLIQLGVKMIKLHPYFQHARLDGRKMTRLMRIITAREIPILCHTGYDVVDGQEGYATPQQILHVYRKIPNLKLICAHCAAWRCPDALKMLLGRNIYLDLSFQPGSGVEPVVRKFATSHPQDYLLFGSDWPWMSPQLHADRIASWGLPQERLAAIMGDNAARLLNL
jgi:Tat protein secretion system quality control protein TatD with DNase activity